MINGRNRPVGGETEKPLSARDNQPPEPDRPGLRRFTGQGQGATKASSSTGPGSVGHEPAEIAAQAGWQADLRHRGQRERSERLLRHRDGLAGVAGHPQLRPRTLVDRSFYLARFVAWAELRGIFRPADVTLPVLEAYQRHVSLRRKSDGTPLAWSTQARYLIPLRAFFSWCAKNRRILSNPAADLVMPKHNHSLPSATFTHEEVEVVLSVPDTSTPIGLRDRVVMEILYATGMRRGEVVGLDLVDVDLARRWLTLRQTKTVIDRVVPMGERAAAWLSRYLSEARGHLLVGEDPGAVFLATNGQRLGATWLTGQVHHYIEASGTGKVGSCHLFRHSCATLMVEGGADIRYVQELPRSPRPHLDPDLHPSRPRASGRHPCRHPPRSPTAPRHRWRRRTPWRFRQPAGGCATARVPSRVLRSRSGSHVTAGAALDRPLSAANGPAGERRRDVAHLERRRTSQ